MQTPRFVSPFACFLLAAAVTLPLSAQISLQITVGPPPIPIYEQPDLPEEGYLWTPGYWAWGEDGYFWVPGTWVQAPELGLLWTPGYWAWSGDSFAFHMGYWGTHVGYYGGINYGHGYGGYGFEGGYWQGRNYYYNRSVSNVNVSRVTNVYSKTVVINTTTIAYNGGEGGLRTAPTAQERSVERERHVQPTAKQAEHRQVASQNRELLVSVNRGKPPVAATARPADFSARNAVPAKAPGGKVEESTLRATPRASTPPAKGPVPDARPGMPASHPPPVPAPQRRPEPAPVPAPERRPAPAPLPEHRPEPTPHPAPPEQPPQPTPLPSPGHRPEPEPRPAPPEHPPQPMPPPGPGHRPEPAPRPAPPEHPPQPGPTREEKPRPQPPSHDGQEPKPRPEQRRD